jgi:UDP-N-acetylglucosamine 2-epimerase
MGARPPGSLNNVHTLSIPFIPRPDAHRSNAVFSAINNGLAGFGITLHDRDKIILKNQISDLVAHLPWTGLLLSAIQPDAIILHADNHPPYQSWVLSARRRCIPSVMFQHGLDCETDVLEKAYADVVAVWGQARYNRYKSHQDNRGHQVCVTGNPVYDRLTFPEEISTTGEYWLWVTRPHVLSKCYSVSRRPDEGVGILRSFIRILEKRQDAKLVIKPHPYDSVDTYQNMIQSSSVEERIHLSSDNVEKLLPQASLVFTEDSTAGLDALFFGKVLIYLHFSKAQIVTPFLEYGAALAGLHERELLSAIQQAYSLSFKDRHRLLQAQRKFIHDFAGYCDGKFTERFNECIAAAIEKKYRMSE